MAKWGFLEVVKFSIYVSIPIVLTWSVAGRPDILEAVIKNRSYVVYPPEGTRPPSAEEMADIIEKRKKDT